VCVREREREKESGREEGRGGNDGLVVVDVFVSGRVGGKGVCGGQRQRERERHRYVCV